MRVRIISYEDVNTWILGKFAKKLNEELTKLGVECDISNCIDKDADINHHIIYLGYNKAQYSACDTLMVTHVDSITKLEILKDQLSVAKVGICMSKATADELVTAGLPPEKICFINPAHDGVIKPKKFNIGITSKVQPDGCKRENMLTELSNAIQATYFRFTIMGMGWDDIVSKLRQKGFEVLYYPDFDYHEYVKLIPALDYYLYLGMDEGSMGFIDALAAGVKTIVTSQGYHLDAPGGITHPFTNMDELVRIFRTLAREKSFLIDSVDTWTWKDYAIKHLELWTYLADQANGHASKYADGVNSLNNAAPGGRGTYIKYLFSLYAGPVRRKYHKLKKIKDFKTFVNKLKSLRSK